MKDLREYLGQAVTYPSQLVNGKAALINDKALVEQSIKIILDTPKGTKFMLPEFGSRLRELAFEPNDEVIEDMAGYFIYEAIRDWEKRVLYVSTQFEHDNEQAVMLCHIKYKILQSNEIESFIYPFYRKLTS